MRPNSQETDTSSTEFKQGREAFPYYRFLLVSITKLVSRHYMEDQARQYLTNAPNVSLSGTELGLVRVTLLYTFITQIVLI